MIPVRLELKNFLPYRSPDPLRFDGIHLACLTGANGAGKSSILDAITWALWGRARAKRDEDLIHMGQNDMIVQLDFEQEGSVYRVVRRRAKGKRSSQGTLDLFILKEDQKPTTISEPSMRQTQEKINGILRLDYETFIHSAFLQQGKADAFTTKTPAERKKILSDILSLDQWERYEDNIKDKLSQITSNLTFFEQRIQEIDRDLARRPGLYKDLDDAVDRQKEAEAARLAAETRLKEVESAPAELMRAQGDKSTCERRMGEHERDLKEVMNRIERHQEQIDDYQKVIDAQEEIEAGYNALQTARETNKSLSDKLMALKTLDDERHELQRQIDNAHTQLKSEINTTLKKIGELEAAATTDHQHDLASVQTEVDALQEKELERGRLDDKINDLREERAKLDTMLKTLTAEGKSLGDRLERLEITNGEDALCPLCGQPLDTLHRAELVAQLNTEIKDKRGVWKENNDRLVTIAADIKEHTATVAEMTVEIKRLSPLIERVGVLHTQIQAAKEAQIKLDAERLHLEQLIAELEGEQFAPEARAQLARLDSKHTELGYDQTSHDDARQQLEAHDQYDQLNTRLKIALESLPSLEQNLEDACARQERLEAAIEEIKTDVIRLESEIIRLTELVKEYQIRVQEVAQQRTLELNAVSKVSAVRQELSALDASEKRKHEYEERRAAMRHQEGLFNELKRAFGKNGVPAMIIETAIPELETTANYLLSRMTDGRMNLRLTTQKEKVTGGVAETLDIEIADELGTRNYEMYSGGEAFRINFAIRIALSQMLARRAGAHLRTLFIDEGFGTQDEEGRTRLVEAINAIQEEFDMILVITHIDDLRDSFPVHIVVEKTSSGSRIALR